MVAVCLELCTCHLNPGTLVVVIDALDECKNTQSRADILKVRTDAAVLTSWLMIIITSGPEVDIIRSLGTAAKHDLGTDQEATADLPNASYVWATPWSSESLFNKVVLRANGLFIFIKTLVLALEGCKDPEDCLKEALQGSVSAGSESLYNLYSSIVKSHGKNVSSPPAPPIAPKFSESRRQDSPATSPQLERRPSQREKLGHARQNVRRQRAAADQALGVGPYYSLRRPHGHGPATTAPTIAHKPSVNAGSPRPEAPARPDVAVGRTAGVQRHGSSNRPSSNSSRRAQEYNGNLQTPLHALPGGECRYDRIGLFTVCSRPDSRALNITMQLFGGLPLSIHESQALAPVHYHVICGNN